MTFRSIPRVALDAYLSLIRLPADGVVRFAGDNAAVASFKLGLDRAEASFRGLAAAVLRDPLLRDDARARSVAAEKREQALRLRGEAEETERRGDQQLEAREQDAERRRREAAERAKRGKREAKERRDEVKADAAKASRGRRDSARKRASRTGQVIAERKNGARVSQLEGKSEAVEEKADALAAADEARRLRGAAAGAKAARKSGADQ